MKKTRRKRLSDKIALQIMQDINENKLKTDAIIEKYKEHGITKDHIYNMRAGRTYNHLRQYV